MRRPRIVPVLGLLVLCADYSAIDARAASAARRIMVIGDSIQAGTGLKDVKDQASWRLQRFGHVVVHNFASPGATMADTFFPGMNHAQTAVRLLHGFFGMYGLIINLGSNDWGQPSITVASFSSTYGAFLDSVPPAIRVVCLSPTWSTSEGVLNSHGETKDDFRTATRTACDARGAIYLEGKDAIPNDPAYFVDGVHPNDRGHKAMGAFLLRQLRALGWIP
jgi:lysophospholipase L1-like esterase